LTEQSTLVRRFTKVAKRVLRTVGFDVYRRRLDFHYAPDFYGRSFVQRHDIRHTPLFHDLAERTIAEGRSCLYYDRLFVLFQTLLNVRRYAPNGVRIIEIGVFKGGTSAFLASTAVALKMHDTQVLSFDTFEGHDSVDVDRTRDPTHKPGDFRETSFESVRAFLQSYSNVTVYQGRFEDRCGVLGEHPIGLVHLDVDLYGPTLHALEFGSSRMVVGGAFVVDDYEVKSCPGVRAAIDDFLVRHPSYFAIHPMTEQCVLVKLGRET
jgi:O-methyltransferase